MNSTAEKQPGEVESSSAAAHCGGEHARGSHRGHWLMIICCLAPLLILGGAKLAGVPLGGGLAVVAMLACPAMHLLMMRGMHAGHDEGGAEHEERRPRE